MKKINLALLQLTSFIFSISPLLVYFIFNHHKYVGTRVEGLKLLFGGTLIVVILVLKALKKLKIPSGVWFFSIMLMLSYFLEAVLVDLKVLSFLALVGEILDSIMQAVISRVKIKNERLKVTSAVEKALEGCISGRV